MSINNFKSWVLIIFSLPVSFGLTLGGPTITKRQVPGSAVYGTSPTGWPVFRKSCCVRSLCCLRMRHVHEPQIVQWRWLSRCQCMLIFSWDRRHLHCSMVLAFCLLTSCVGNDNHFRHPSKSTGTSDHLSIIVHIMQRQECLLIFVQSEVIQHLEQLKPLPSLGLPTDHSQSWWLRHSS